MFTYDDRPRELTVGSAWALPYLFTKHDLYLNVTHVYMYHEICEADLLSVLRA